MATGILTGFYTAVQQLIHLLERAEKKKEVIFRDFIEDLYTRFEPVAQNYIRVFENLGRQAVSAVSTTAFDEAFREFGKEREEFESLRRTIGNLASSYATAKGLQDDKIRAFLENMKDFFYDAGSAASMSRAMQERFHALIENRKNIARRRLQIDQELTVWEFRGHPPPSPGNVRTDSVYDRIARQERRAALDQLDQEERQNREECVREALDNTDRCKNILQNITRLYAELKVKYLLH